MVTNGNEPGSLLQEIEKIGITNRKFAEKYKEWMDAYGEKVTKDGVVVKIVDYYTQTKSADMLHKLRGDFKDGKASIEINIKGVLDEIKSGTDSDVKETSAQLSAIQDGVTEDKDKGSKGSTVQQDMGSTEEVGDSDIKADTGEEADKDNSIEGETGGDINR